MSKLKYLIYKDYLILIRDKAGLLLMFAMPILLVTIMTYLQDSTFNSINETKIPLLLINNDADSLGATIGIQIKKSGVFDVSDNVDGKQPTKDDMIKYVAEGRYMIGIFIPDNATTNIRKNVKRYVAGVFNGFPVSTISDSIQIDIFIDPVAKSSFRQLLMSSLREYALRTESEFLFKEITAEVNKMSPMPIADIELSREKVQFKEQYAVLSSSDITPDSTQHNVPAWTLFAIFFVTVSLAGNIIKERDDGSFTRLLTTPCSYSLYITGKAIVYLIVCLILLAIIILQGMYLFPALGLPALDTGGRYTAILLTGGSSALAAIGYGVAIGKISRTHQQASIFASISTVIMAATGGVWIPVFFMPSFMKFIGKLSPLNWGIEGFYTIFIRNGDWISVLPYCSILLLFAAICMTVAVIYNKIIREK